MGFTVQARLNDKDSQLFNEIREVLKEINNKSDIKVIPIRKYAKYKRDEVLDADVIRFLIHSFKENKQYYKQHLS